MDDERRKKIETGRLKLAEFKKKRCKKTNTKSMEESVAENIANQVPKENTESIKSSCAKIRTVDNMDILTVDRMNLITENPSQQIEVISDDASHFEDANCEVLSLYSEKIESFQVAVKHRDDIIQKLTNRLASTMSANEAADSAGSEEIKNLKQEINLLHQQMKEAAEMLEKQKSKMEPQEESQVCEDSIVPKDVSEKGTQVENSETMPHLSLPDNTESLEILFSKFPQTPDLPQKLCEFLKSTTPQDKLCAISKDLFQWDANSSYKSTSTLEVDSSINSSDLPAVLKRLEGLNSVAKLIESLLSSSVKMNDDMGDFSCSKFQSFFLKKMNSPEAEPEISENESTVSDINYVEVLETPLSKSATDFPSIEKLRSRGVVDDFSLVADFLVEEVEKISSLVLQSMQERVPHGAPGPQGDCAPMETRDIDSTKSSYQEIAVQKSKLECRLNNLKQLEERIRETEKNIRHRSVDSDTLTNYDDNILLEEPPLSCISLLSLTDSESKTEYATTDSEINTSRKVSYSFTRPTQEKECCTKCDKYSSLLREKFDDHLCLFRDSIKNSLKNLESQVEKLELERDESSKQIELLYQEQKMKLQHMNQKCEVDIQDLTSKHEVERNNLLLKMQDLEEKLVAGNKETKALMEQKNELIQKISVLQSERDEQDNLVFNVKDLEEKLSEATKQAQCVLADRSALVEKHQEEVRALEAQGAEYLQEERKRIEAEYISTYEVLKKLHEDEIEDLKHSFLNKLEETESSLKKEHCNVLSMMETHHSSESAAYQKKIEHLLEEKCELLSKTTQEYEAILKKNHKILMTMCNHLCKKLDIGKEKILNESQKSTSSVLEMSFSDALDELDRSIKHGMLKFLNQNYFLTDGGEENFDETEYLSIEIRHPVTKNDFPLRENPNNFQKVQSDAEKDVCWSKSLTQLSERAQLEGSLESDDMHMIRFEINKLQEEFQKDAVFYENINAQLHRECQSLRVQAKELEEHKRKLESQLQEKEKELTTKESQIAALDASSNDAAQTNSRLLHVLSDLVKTFMDIEHDINTHLVEHGLIPSRTGTLAHHDDETGHSVGSREDFASLSIGECPALELVEDGPDLTPRTWDIFASAGAYDTEVEGEDVVLGASRRLKLAVDHLLNLLGRALDNQQNQDLKLLLKRNEELSQELQEESQGRDALHMELVTAESSIRKLEAEKQRQEDLNQDLKENQEMTKRELCTERNKVAQLLHEKEVLCDEIQTLKGQCEMLASRLGDPERIDSHKKLNSTSVTCTELLQENSRLSTEKQSVQKSLSVERQSFLDRLHQMEMALEELNAEKDEIVDKKCKEIQNLKAEMEAMEKQLNSNKKFIDEQAQEREQERDECIRELTKMQELVREKEKVQSKENQLLREIESLEQLLNSRIEDHQNAMKKKEIVENDLRQSLNTIQDLREVIAELEGKLEMKCKTEITLKQRLAGLNESINVKEKVKLDSSEQKPEMPQVNGESMEQVENLKERLASQSQEIEQMSQNQTLLHELRGQIHFLEAKVEQRARLLESMHLSSLTSPIQSDDNSPSGSENIQLPCEDGYEMSPRSIHWLEVRRLEEKIGRLVHIDEELIRKNKELEVQLKRVINSQIDSQHENSALQSKLSEQLLQISVLKSHIEEQKCRYNAPQKSQATTEKIEELHEAFEKQLENNKRLLSELQESQTAVNMLADEIKKRDRLITVLQKDAAARNKLPTHSETDGKSQSRDAADINGTTACYKLMLLEKSEELECKTLEIEQLNKALENLQKCSENSMEVGGELKLKTKIVEELTRENSQLKSSVEHLNNEIQSLNQLLVEAKSQLEIEQAQVETLCAEMATLPQNYTKDSGLPSSDTTTLFKTLEEENTFLTNKMANYEVQLREKNAEISSLNSSITNLRASFSGSKKELEFEQVQVETLMQELGSVMGYQKRLEEDFNVVQEMMQQKERELSTLQEETDYQMKLESELESLEKELEEKNKVENNLQQTIKELEMALLKATNASELKSKEELDKLKKTSSDTIDNLKKQINILRNNLSRKDGEDIDILDIKQEIMEAAKTFSSADSEVYGDVVYNLLKKAVDMKLDQMVKKHEMHMIEISATWEQKIRSELHRQKSEFKDECSRLEKENLLLREKFEEHNQRLSSDKNAQFQLKLNELENSLKIKYNHEFSSLKSSLDEITREKATAETKVKVLNHQIKNIKKKTEAHKNEMLKEFESKAVSIEDSLRKQIETREELESNLQKELERLQTELESSLEKVKNMEAKHEAEIANLHKFFEMRWVTEMKKIQTNQIEELMKLKDSKEKNVEALCNHLFSQYSEKLKKLQDEYTEKLAEDQQSTVTAHKAELHQLKLSLESQFQREKQVLLDIKDKEIKHLADTFEKRHLEQKTLLDHGKSPLRKKKWEDEKFQLVSAHKKEMIELRRDLEEKYERMLQMHLRAHETQMKSLEDTYSRQVEEVHDLLKEAKHAANRTCHSDISSMRTTTPSSEVTSSDEACSSCQEDMLPHNKHILVNKIHQDGKRILSLIQGSVPKTSEHEARLWLEERKWIISVVKKVTPDIVENSVNLKLVISNIIDELLQARRNLVTSIDELENTKEKFLKVEDQLNSERSKLYVMANSLSHQTQVIKELESMLNASINELLELKKGLMNETKLQHNSIERSSSLYHSRNLNSPLYDVGCLRSAGDISSTERFSGFLPEIESVNLQKTSEEIVISRESTPLPQFKDSDYRNQPTSPENVCYESKNEVSSLKESSAIVSDSKLGSSSIAKLHGLHWVYKRSLAYNKSLVYQKKYLLQLLRGFQATETVTLAWLTHMDNNNPAGSTGPDSSCSDAPLRGKSLFKSVVFVVVAIQRMRYYVRRWRMLARMPSPQVVETRIRAVFQSHSMISIGECYSSSASLSSKANSIRPFSNSQSLTNSRSDNINKEYNSNPDKRQLIEYVHRLQTLQRQLGLDTLR